MQSSFCLLDLLRLPTATHRGRLMMRCLDDRDKRWLACTALLTTSSLCLLLPSAALPGAPPSGPRAPSGSSWRLLSLANATLGPVSGSTFELNTTRAAYSLQAGGPAQAEQWARALRAAIEAVTECSMMEAAENMGQDWAEASAQGALMGAVRELAGALAALPPSPALPPPPALMHSMRGKHVDARTVTLPPHAAVFHPAAAVEAVAGGGAAGAAAPAPAARSPLFHPGPGSVAGFARVPALSALPLVPSRLLSTPVLEAQAALQQQQQQLSLPPMAHLEAAAIAGAGAGFLARAWGMVQAQERTGMGTRRQEAGYTAHMHAAAPAGAVAAAGSAAAASAATATAAASGGGVGGGALSSSSSGGGGRSPSPMMPSFSPPLLASPPPRPSETQTMEQYLKWPAPASPGSASSPAGGGGGGAAPLEAMPAAGEGGAAAQALGAWGDRGRSPSGYSAGGEGGGHKAPGVSMAKVLRYGGGK